MRGVNGRAALDFPKRIHYMGEAAGLVRGK